MTLHEPAVALTDFGLALECGLFVWLLVRRREGAGDPLSPRGWWTVFFAGVGLAALAGGIVHGFTVGPGLARAVLWRLTLLAVGGAAFAAWVIGARMLWGPLGAWRMAVVAGLLYAGYAAVVLVVSQRFAVAVAYYLPAVLFLTYAFARAYRQGRPGAGAGLAGLAATFVAAAVQQAGVSLHRVHFDHNALYHLVQAVGLFLLFRGASKR